VTPGAARRGRRRARGATVATVAFTTLVAMLGLPGGGQRAAAQGGSTITPWDWPTYGHDPQHSFHARTTLTERQASTLAPAWSFSTGDAVTATPTVVGGTVYVGSWDDYFYAVSLRTGQLKWKFKLNPQPAITPQPGQTPRDITSDGGMVTSSAWFEPGREGRPDLVIFGGGYTLYALDARTGQLYWEHAYTGRPDLPPDPVNDGTRIFSSPVVFDGKVIFAVSVDGARGYRGYIAAASLTTGDPVWTYETDVDSSGQILNDGCGDVWSSATVLPRAGDVVFDTADCHFSDQSPMSESVIALSAVDGHLVWQYRPQRTDPHCDLDFGATANAGLEPDGRASFLGVGGKDGTYYSLDPATGSLRWSTNVVFGGVSGGFIGSTAYDGHHVYGSTALGDFGNGGPCDPANPADTAIQEPSVHAFDSATGAVTWQETGAQSFGPTTVAGGMTFNAPALSPVLLVRDAATGSLIDQVRLPVSSWSGVAVVGDAVIVGTGTSYMGSPDGVVVLTPGGGRPRIPGGG
jgi:polyvinyl alcohol dehydrogenase (cytochrome)